MNARRTHIVKVRKPLVPNRFNAPWLPPHGWTLHERVDDQEW